MSDHPTAKLPAQPRQDDRQYLPLAVICFSFFAAVGWFFPWIVVLMGGVCGLWLVGGRGSYWLRMVVTAVTLFPALITHPFWAGIAGMGLGWTLLFTFVAQTMVAWHGLIPARSIRFALADFGGLIFAMGLVFAFARICVATYEPEPGREFIGVIFGPFYFGLCCSVSGFPLLMPDARRTEQLGYLVAAVLLGLIPLLMGALASLGSLEGLFLVPVMMLLANAVGAFLLWMVLMPMVLGGLFEKYLSPREEDVPR